MSNKELAEKLHKNILDNFKKRKLYSSFIGNIWGAHLVDMELISKFSEGIALLSLLSFLYFQ